MGHPRVLLAQSIEDVAAAALAATYRGDVPVDKGSVGNRYL